MDETLKHIERRSLNRAEAMKEAERPNPRPKEGRSTFDELLEQSRSLSEQAAKPKLQQKTLTKEALPEAHRLKERQRERNKDSEEKEEQRQDSRGERREGSDGAKKVVGKQGTKQDQGEGKGGSSHEKGTLQKRGEKTQFLFKKGLSPKAAIGSHEFAKQFQTRLAQAARLAPKTIPQDILNQVVRYVRLGQKADGTHVFEIKCREALFQGLSLRFEAGDGKVSIEFLTANREVRALFAKEIPSLHRLLTQKGIAVANIVVA
ncbi:MAG: hypothetical protein HY609_01000 [Deltaproteobacteria bacterium]|nr:hypothetical protein [Deltaproteobacteria bacterium]